MSGFTISLHAQPVNKYKKICQSINEDYYDKLVSLDVNEDIDKQRTEMLINKES